MSIIKCHPERQRKVWGITKQLMSKLIIILVAFNLILFG